MGRIGLTFFSGWLIAITGCWAIGADATAAESQQLFCLSYGFPSGSADEGARGILLRELARQGVLIAARDELGLTTRDVVLGESITPEDIQWRLMPPEQRLMQIAVKPPTALKVQTNLTDGLEIHVMRPIPRPAPRVSTQPITRTATKPATRAATRPTTRRVLRPPQVWDETATISLSPGGMRLSYRTILEQSEKLSRGKWVEVIRKAGYDGKANVWTADAPAPAEVEALLGQFDLVSQFDAVRRTHAAIRESGESLPRLGALVRGYAHLGKLTELQWSHKAQTFKARALLYAHRMTAREPKSAMARYYKAYAYAWAGFHQYAMDDLAAAEELMRDSNDSVPPWAGLLGPYCRYDVGALSDVMGKNPALAAEASLLCYFSVENYASRVINVGYAEAALTANPECLRLIDGINDGHAALGETDAATMRAFSIFARTLYQRVGRVQGVSAAVKAAASKRLLKEDVPDATGYAALAKALFTAPDDQEFSLVMLGELVRDESFVMINARAEYLDWSLGVDGRDFLLPLRAMYMNHHYAQVMDFHAGPWSATDRWKKLPPPEALSDAVGPALQELSFHVYAARQGDRLFSDVIAQSIIDQEDNDAFSAGFMLGYLGEAKDRVARAKELLAVSPYHPVARAKLIEDDWDEFHGKALEWEKDADTQPMIAGALAKHYSWNKEYDRARPLLERYIAKAPDRWAYKLLAENKLAGGDEAGWLATMEAFIRLDDGRGLEAALVQVDIANHFMEKGDYRKARPYAEEAGNTGAAFGMECASLAAEGDGDFNTAEKWLIDCADRYDLPAPWYLWCRRTHRGHLAEATAAMEPLAESAMQSDDREVIVYPAGIYLEGGENGRATRLLKRAVELDGDVWSALHLALNANASGEVAVRDAYLTMGITKVPSFESKGFGVRTEMIRVAEMFQEAWKEGGKAGFDLAAVDKVMETAIPKERSNIEYFVGEFLRQAGRADEAKKYFQRSAAGERKRQTNVVLAGMRIKEMGGAPAEKPGKQ